MGIAVTVPFSFHFARTVARQVLAAAEDVRDLSAFHICVPAPRQVQALRQAFLVELQAQGRSGGLLPHIFPLHATPEMAQMLEHIGLLAPCDQRLVSPTERQHVLTRLVLAKEKSAGAQAISYTAAWAMAGELGQTLDELRTFGLTAADIQAHLPSTFAQHWQQTWDFLELLEQAYPAWLQEQNAQDESARNQDILTALAVYYQQPEQAHLRPWAVGFADTTPQGMAVLQSFLAHKNGAVVLPGLDVALWQSGEALSAAHAQVPLQNMARQLGLAEVAVWADVPQEQTALTVLSPQHTVQEAQALAALVRQKLAADEDMTCAVVTPDRALAKLVQQELALYNIIADDSAGMPLQQAPAGQAVLALVQCVAQRCAPVAVAQVLKAPLFGFDAEAVALLEKHVLRGLTPAAGLDGLRQKLAQAERISATERTVCVALLEGGEALLAPLFALPRTVQLPQVVAALQTVLAEREVPQLLDDTFKTLAAESHAAGFLTWAQVLEALTLALQAATVRPVVKDVRCFIWGPLEARLQQVDVLLLAGLVEGMWPRSAPAAGWIPAPVRQRLGLPPVAQPLALAAHDFASLYHGAADVVLSTRQLENGQEVLPSRFVARQEAQDAARFQTAKQAGAAFLAALQPARSAGFAPVAVAPTGHAPLALRPQAWSASTLDALMNNPYGVFVTKILGVEPWEPFAQNVTPAVRGTVLHAWLQAFWERAKGIALPPFGKPVTVENKEEACAYLKTLADAAVAGLPLPTQRLLLPRLYGITADIVQAWVDCSAAGQVPTRFEQKGSMALNGLTFHARADRVDASAAGAWVVDYKTGGVPTVKEVLGGTKPQLALEFLLAQQGAFGGDAGVAGVAVWQVAATSQDGFQVHAYGREAFAKLDEGYEEILQTGLNTLAAALVDEGFTFAYAPTKNWQDYNGLEALARVAEWAKGGEDGADETE